MQWIRAQKGNRFLDNLTALAKWQLPLFFYFVSEWMLLLKHMRNAPADMTRAPRFFLPPEALHFPGNHV
jgi:hypothetical protein